MRTRWRLEKWFVCWLASLWLVGCAALIGGDYDNAHLAPDSGSDVDLVLPDSSGHCPSDRKLCGGYCALLDSPKYGCASATCDACASANGSATCTSGACGVGACDPGHGDCDGSVENGCGMNCVRNDAADGGSEGDDGGKAIVLFGGAETNDTWEWDGNNWNSIATSDAPSVRWGTAMAAFGEMVLLFGGSSAPGLGVEDTLYGDTWVWDGHGWTELNVTGPAARVHHVMANLNGSVVLYGGANANGLLHDTWMWNGSAWAEYQGSSPPGRVRTAVATLGPKVFLFGGLDSASDPMDDLWAWNGVSWAETTPSSPWPSANAFHAFATLSTQIVLFGAEYGDEDTWEWNGVSWTDTNVTGPNAHYGASNAAMAALNGEVIYYGGELGTGGSLTETWSWNRTQWTQLNVDGPGVRAAHAMATRY